jgi:hypothetical protein
MDRQSPLSLAAIRVLSALLIGIFFLALMLTAGRYTFSYMAQWHAGVFQSQFFIHAVQRPGGFAAFLADTLCATFDAPLTGILVTGLLLTLITLLLAEVLSCLSGTRLWTPLAVLPGVGLLYLHYQPNALYVATVSFLMATLALWGSLRFTRRLDRYLYPVLSALALYALAGPVALLYAVWLCLMAMAKDVRRGWWTLALPVMVAVLGLLSWQSGMAGDWRPLLTPEGYFTLRLPSSSLVYLPWSLSLAVMLLAAGWGKVPALHRLAARRVAAVAGCVAECVAVVAFAGWGVRQHVSPESEFFKRLSYYSAHRNYPAILDACRQRPMNNLLFQNYLNMALAEEGLLADSLFREPCVDIQTIYVRSDKTPYVGALLSDIYFSMGHIALAQRYAFEANEGMNNTSPRMLRRLVQTNLIFGAYAVAEKYLDVLDRIPLQQSWVKAHRRFLHDEAALLGDQLLGAKRRCLFPDNRFAGSLGLDDDLRQILLSNPSHRPTVLYLGCLYLLSKDLPRFQQTLDTFYGTEALPKGYLPVAFQEAVAWMGEAQPEWSEHYPVSRDVSARWERFKQRPASERQSLWYFLKFRQ